MHNQRKTTNFKTKTNQNRQKIELYGSLTIKELKKKHSFRLVRGVETGSRGGEDVQQGGGWRTGLVKWQLVELVVPYLHARQSTQPWGSSAGERKPQNLWL